MTVTPSLADRPVAHALLVAGLFVGASLVIRRLSPDYLSAEVAQRMLGVLMGALVVAYANAAPKALTPLIHLRCNATTEQTLRRFGGWTILLGGLGYMAAWLAAPYEIAAVLAMCLLGTAWLVAMARTAWSVARR